MVLVGAAARMSIVRAQEPGQLIGFLSGYLRPIGSFANMIPGPLAAFSQGLKEMGFIEGGT
jgi:hypothetical protein